MPRFYKYDNNHGFTKIPEETETFSSTTSENGSVPKTEVEVLPFKVMMMMMVIMMTMINDDDGDDDDDDGGDDDDDDDEW